MKKSLLLKLIILIVGIIAVIVLFFVSHMKEHEALFGNKNVVYKEELGDMFSVIELSSEEIAGYFTDDVSEILTWQDIYHIFDKLGYEKVIPDRSTYVINEHIPRDRAGEIYQQFLNVVNVEIEHSYFTYYGHVPGEDKIVTNTGNYETDLPKEFFTYGERYKAYTDGNNILFISAVEVSAETSAQTELPTSSESTQVVIPSFINVVLTNDNNQEALRSDFQVKITSSCSVTCGTKKQNYDKNKVFSAKNLSSFFEMHDVIMIIPDKEQSILVKQKDTGTWSAPYRGILFVYKNGNQYFLVNQVSLEQYLYGVVPGEMPERFHLEALKAQAVCARTYACNMMCKDAYKEYFADVDDSVNCQVYNKHGENEKAIQAVEETKGVVMAVSDKAANQFSDLELADIYYFSTSCGFTTGLEAWGDESVDYLTSVTTLTEPIRVDDWDTFLKNNEYVAFDSGSNYFRWKAEISLPEGYMVSIDKREESGIVTKITYTSTEGNRSVSTENKIRRDLSIYVTKMTDSNGKLITEMTMLPSAWFTIEKGNETGKYILYGGGYGHGIGMSQYGAHGMAKANYSYIDILSYYYSGIILKNLSYE